MQVAKNNQPMILKTISLYTFIWTDIPTQFFLFNEKASTHSFLFFNFPVFALTSIKKAHNFSHRHFNWHSSIIYQNDLSESVG